MSAVPSDTRSLETEINVATLHWCDRCVLISIPVSLVATIYHANLSCNTFRGGGKEKAGGNEWRPGAGQVILSKLLSKKIEM